MQQLTRVALKAALNGDDSIPQNRVERFLAIISGAPINRDDYVRVIKVKDAARIIGVTPAGINAYVKRGLLSRVVDDREHTLGIRSDSIATFMQRRIVSYAKTEEKAK